jgi:hypothetical protein
VKTLALVVVFVLGCSRELRQKFVRIDPSFTPAPHEQLPKVLVDLPEIYAEPPMRAVGVLQISGASKKPVDDFLHKVAEAGAALGCDAMMQADVFELDPRQESLNPVRNPLGVFWVAGDEAGWQFICGVKGASDFEAARTYELALEAAGALRDSQFGMRVCDRNPPTGSHVPSFFVCSEMKGVTGRSIGMSNFPSFGSGLGK